MRLNNNREDCLFHTPFQPLDEHTPAVESGLFNPAKGLDENGEDRDSGHTAATVSKREGFHWHRTFAESVTFLVIEQEYVIHTDFNWVVSESGIPFNHYWRDSKQSLSEWVHSGWEEMRSMAIPTGSGTSGIPFKDH